MLVENLYDDFPLLWSLHIRLVKSAQAYRMLLIHQRLLSTDSQVWF